MNIAADGFAPFGGLSVLTRWAYGRRTGIKTNGMTVTADFYARIVAPIELIPGGRMDSVTFDPNTYCSSVFNDGPTSYWNVQDGDFKPYDSGVNEGWSNVGSGTIDSEGTCISGKVGANGMPEKPSGEGPHAHPDGSQRCWATDLTRLEGWVVADEMLVLKWDMEGY